jgi:hypothetical protein
VDPRRDLALPELWCVVRHQLFGRREYLAVSPSEQIREPYSRAMVLHVTILAGGFLIAILGTPVAALGLLVVSKTAIDVRAHLKEHRKAERRLDEASANDWSAWTETNR